MRFTSTQIGVKIIVLRTYCEMLTHVSRNTRILIPRIHLTHSGTRLPFSFKHTQFPVNPAFVMKDIN